MGLRTARRCAGRRGRGPRHRHRHDGAAGPVYLSLPREVLARDASGAVPARSSATPSMPPRARGGRTARGPAGRRGFPVFVTAASGTEPARSACSDSSATSTRSASWNPGRAATTSAASHPAAPRLRLGRSGGGRRRSVLPGYGRAMDPRGGHAASGRGGRPVRRRPALFPLPDPHAPQRPVGHREHHEPPRGARGGPAGAGGRIDRGRVPRIEEAAAASRSRSRRAAGRGEAKRTARSTRRS